MNEVTRLLVRQNFRPNLLHECDYVLCVRLCARFLHCRHSTKRQRDTVKLGGNVLSDAFCPFDLCFAALQRPVM